jgi:cysteine synthase
MCKPYGTIYEKIDLLAPNVLAVLACDASGLIAKFARVQGVLVAVPSQACVATTMRACRSGEAGASIVWVRCARCTCAC